MPLKLVGPLVGCTPGVGPSAGSCETACVWHSEDAVAAVGARTSWPGCERVGAVSKLDDQVGFGVGPVHAPERGVDVPPSVRVEAHKASSRRRRNKGEPRSPEGERGGGDGGLQVCPDNRAGKSPDAAQPLAVHQGSFGPQREVCVQLTDQRGEKPTLSGGCDLGQVPIVL